MNARTLPVLVALAALVLALVFKGAFPVGGDPGDIFDAEAARARLERILADAPHPVDTAGNDRVGARIMAELRGLGLNPEVQDTVACHAAARAPTVSCARVRNIIARINPGPGPHLLIASHYDSNPTSPGASDAGLGIATSLEIARQLMREGTRRPVTFLLTDGEEAGLLGANAFMDKHPIARRVDSLINLEARGVTGRALMFETGTPNGSAVRAYRAVERPAGNSLTADFAKLIPNSTDVEIFKRAGWTTLNFAVIGNETRYHSAGDDLAAFDLATLDHMGGQAMAAARAIAAAPVEAKGGERVYFDLLGRHLVDMPLWTACTALLLLLALHAAIAWKDRRQVSRALAAILASALAATAVTFAMQALIGALRPGQYWRAHPEYVDAALITTALVAALALSRAWPAGSEGARRAYWLLFLASGGLLTLIVPGASIFYLLPGAVALIGTATRDGVARASSLVAAIIALATFGPLVALSQDLLGMGQAWLFAPMIILLITPFLVEIRTWGAISRTVLAIAGIAALACWGAVLLAPAYSSDRRQAFAIEYLWDQDRKAGRVLIANDGAALPEVLGEQGFQPGFRTPYARGERWSARAAEPLAPFAVRVAGQERTSSGRRVALRVTAPEADSLIIRVPAKAGLQAAGMGGAARRFNASGQRPHLVRCQGRSCRDARIDLWLDEKAPVEIEVMALRYANTAAGLPAPARSIVEARPALATPQYLPDMAISLRRVRL